MITSTIIEINGEQYRLTKSDTYYIQKVGTEEIYLEALDELDSTFKYIETDQPRDDNFGDNYNPKPDDLEDDQPEVETTD